MKRLFIIRHAKSSWKDSSLDDFDRPLNKRGERDAPFMGELLKNKGIYPDLILSSPANRAKTTAEVFAEKLRVEDKIIFYQNIYEASELELESILKQIEDKKDIVFLFGHNPELNSLAFKLVGFEENIPTCAIVEIKFNVKSWNDIDKSNSKLISFEYPKKYLSKEEE